jgi:multidrug efflux system outer membrane protein
MRGNESRLVEPVIIPRSIPACTDELLQGQGKLAGDTGCSVQLLDAQRTRLEAEDALAESETALNVAAVAIYKAFGGAG